MSDFYELALMLTVKPDATQEAIATLQHMVEGRGLNLVPSLSNPIFSEPVRTAV